MKSQIAKLSSLYLLALHSSISAKAIEKPNIIFILTDDQRTSAMGTINFK